MSRWKGKGAKKIAESKPLSGLYDEIRSWSEPLECTLSAGGAIARVEPEKLRPLLAACFGSAIANSADEHESSHILNLLLEEAFYLGYELRCLEFYAQKPEVFDSEFIELELTMFPRDVFV